MALLSRALLAKALLDKTTRQYAEKPTWGPYSYDKDIYPQARLAFPEYNKLYSTNEEFTKYFVRDLNNKNPKLLQKISAGVVTKEDQVLIDQFNQTTTAEQVAAEPQQAEAQQVQPVGTATGIPFGGMGLPTVPSIPSSPRIRVVHKVPQAQVEGQKLFVADSSGTVVGVKEITPTSVRSVPQGPSEFHVADKSGNIVATYSREPAPTATKGLGSETPPSKILIANKSGVVTGIRNIQSPGWFKDFRSNAKIFAKQNLGRIGQGLWNMGKIGTGGAYNFGVRLGNGGLNAFARISRPGGLGGGGIRNLSKSSNKLAIGLVAGLIFFVLISGVIGGLGGTTPTGQAAPTNNNFGLDYTLPLRDTSIVVNDIRSTILKQWPNAKIDNWQIIIDQAKLQGWNPAVLLTLWIEESGAQGAANYTDALGCDVGKPTQDIQISLKCFFDSFNNKFTNDQFAQFMLTYSAPNDPFPFKSNPNFPKNFKDWYSKLVPSGAGAIVAITPTPAIGPSTTYTPGGGSGILSCPVNNGSVIYGSKETGGHCATGYGFDCIKPGQTGYTGRETAVDVKGSDRMVFLPLLSGNSVEWTIDESGTPINDSEGGGIAVAATASSGGKAYRIRFVHIEATALKVGQKANSATPVGQHLLPSIDRRSFANHVHITIQEEGTYKPADLYFNLCK